MIIRKEDICLLIYSMQTEFLPSLLDAQLAVDSCFWLVELAGKLGIPIVIINHAKLGSPIPCFTKLAGKIHHVEVTDFSCLDDLQTRQLLERLGKKQILMAGAETHVSILQSALALNAWGKEVFVALDSCTSRNLVDHQAALRRLQIMGIPTVTKEMFFFECLHRSDDPCYLSLSLEFLDQRHLRLE